MNDARLASDSTATVEATRANNARRLSPPVDIFENSEGFLLVADLPGVQAEGVTVEYNPPELAVTANRPEADGIEAVVYQRRFELGAGIDPSNIKAELRNGVLRIELQKSAAVRPRRISVRAA